MKIKAVFTEENYVPQSQIESTALHCVTIIQAETHQLFQGRACKNTILVKLEITKCCGYLGYKVKVINFLTPNNVSMQIWWRKPTGSEERAQKRLILQFLRMVTL